jgi:hypothetical protein
MRLFVLGFLGARHGQQDPARALRQKGRPGPRGSRMGASAAGTSSGSYLHCSVRRYAGISAIALRNEHESGLCAAGFERARRALAPLDNMAIALFLSAFPHLAPSPLHLFRRIYQRVGLVEARRGEAFRAIAQARSPYHTHTAHRGMARRGERHRTSH